VDQSDFKADTEDGAPTPGVRRALPWTELSIDAARVRKRKDGGSVFVVCDGRLAGSKRVTFFLTLADNGNSFAVERGIALLRAIIKAGSEPTATAKHETLLTAAAQRLATLRPIEVTGALIEQSGSFTPRLEIDDVRAVAATTTVEAAP
jgi:hypothetical protein